MIVVVWDIQNIKSLYLTETRLKDWRSSKEVQPELWACPSNPGSSPGNIVNFIIFCQAKKEIEAKEDNKKTKNADSFYFFFFSLPIPFRYKKWIEQLLQCQNTQQTCSVMEIIALYRLVLPVHFVVIVFINEIVWSQKVLLWCKTNHVANIFRTIPIWCIWRCTLPNCLSRTLSLFHNIRCIRNYSWTWYVNIPRNTWKARRSQINIGNNWGRWSTKSWPDFWFALPCCQEFNCHFLSLF